MLQQTTPVVELSLLGHVEIRRNGQPLEGFVSAKVEALLIYLAVTGRPHGRETLAGLFWGDKPESRARANLRKALSNLRQLLGGLVTITEQTVVFNRGGAYRLDVTAFEAALAAAGATPPNPDTLRRAVELYRGDFLTGFVVETSLPFEEWALAERERLRRLAIQALHQLAAAYTAQGEYTAGINVVCRLLALEPWQEEAHRQLMTLLARSGQQAAALAQFETCRRILANELGVEPLPETQALYQRLKSRGQFAPHNLPPQSTPFVGREAELAQIAAYLDRAECRLLTLVGAGGMGKTRLALQSAAENLSLFKDGVYVVSLVGVRSAKLLAPAIAKVAGCPLAGSGQPERQLIDYLAGREMLLILDNFEQLLTPPGAEELLVKILAGAPHVKLLVTSREWLKLREEWVVTVEGLTYPDEEAEGGLTGAEAASQSIYAYSAIKLFVQHAQRLRADFALTAANQPDIIRLCRLVNGMPLGLELAATWTPLLSCAEIVAEVERDLDFLTDSSRQIPERHRSLRAVFESSWNLLTDAEQDGLKKLAIFKGKFQREAAIHATGASLQLLLTLFGKSLLRRDTLGRYSMPELLGQYVLEKLAHSSGSAVLGRNRALEELATTTLA